MKPQSKLRLSKPTIVQRVWDFIGIPFRLLLFDQEWLPRFGWTTLLEERLRAVIPHICGRVLDIGAGSNDLLRIYGDGYGVDIIDWGGGAVLVDNTAELPFTDNSFDTITFVACLNHIPNRQEVIEEARRVLKTNGKVIVTMIDPILGWIGHALWWYSEDKKRGGMLEGELPGMWSSQIIELMEAKGFQLVQNSRFLLWMNNLLVFRTTK